MREAHHLRSVRFGLTFALIISAMGRAAPAADLVVQEIDASTFPANNVFRVGTIIDSDPRSAYSARATICNTDTGNVSVSISSALHPKVSQNLYRIKNGRMQQIGMSWSNHTAIVVNEDLCDVGACATSMTTTDAIYSFCATRLTGLFLSAQTRLGPRREINPQTGLAPSPFTSSGQTGVNVLSKQLQVRHSDLDPALNAGARYLYEIQVINSEDSDSNTHTNNVSSREVIVQKIAANDYNLFFTGPTFVSKPAVSAWAEIDPQVQLNTIDIPDDGRLILASNVDQIAPNRWRYNWSLYNQDSFRAVSGLSIPVPEGAVVESADFVDVSYHSGDGFVFGTSFDGTDWPAQTSGNSIQWQTDDFASNPNANALRWGTTYSFQLVTNSPPTASTFDVELYRAAARAGVAVNGLGPGNPGEGACCMANGTCTSETELSCQLTGGVYQGDSITCIAALCAQPGDSRLVLETASDCPGDSNGAGNGDIFEVELWMRDLTAPASGFQAFLLYDPSLLQFRSDLSTYTAAPFVSHLASIPAAEIGAGLINLDGSSGFGGGSTSADSLLATLAFEVLVGADCETTRIQFRQNLPFRSELSDQGQAIATLLVPTNALTFDDVNPSIMTTSIATCYPDVPSAEAAAIAASPASDNCTDAIDLIYQTSVSGDLCNLTIDVTVMDECGNAVETSYMTRVDDSAPVLNDPPSDISVIAPNGTCAAVVTFSTPDFSDNCTGSPDVVCTPPSGSTFSVGTTTVVCVANDECGNTTEVSFDVDVDAIRDRLELRIVNPRDCYEDGDRICVELVMTCLDQSVTGFNAFVAFDADALDFVAASSSYENVPFPIHIASPISASVLGSVGSIALDGSSIPGSGGSADDAVLATMCFDVRPGMGGQQYAFEFGPPPTPTIQNELSINGSPVATVLSNDQTQAPNPRLRLAMTTIRECYLPNDLICVELQMACLGDQPVTGFNAFVDFDPAVLRFESGAYTNSPFPIHLSTIDAIDGQLTLDGSDLPGSPGTTNNSVLATLCFRIQKSAPGTSTTIDFGPPPTPSIDSELSINGTPVPTILEPTGILTQSTLGLRVCYEPLSPVCVLLEATCLDVAVTGFTAEVEYDNDVLEFLPGASGYESPAFPVHINEPIVPAISGTTGQFSLDGEVSPMGSPVIDDTVLASLCFNIRPGFEAAGATVAFQTPMPGMESRFLLNGSPVAAFLRDAPPFGIAGDIDIDGDVDAGDVSAFIDILLNVDTDEARRLRSDLNCDARADGRDIQELVRLLLP